MRSREDKKDREGHRVSKERLMSKEVQTERKRGMFRVHEDRQKP